METSPQQEKKSAENSLNRTMQYGNEFCAMVGKTYGPV